MLIVTEARGWWYLRGWLYCPPGLWVTDMSRASLPTHSDHRVVTSHGDLEIICYHSRTWPIGTDGVLDGVRTKKLELISLKSVQETGWAKFHRHFSQMIGWMFIFLNQLLALKRQACPWIFQTVSSVGTNQRGLSNAREERGGDRQKKKGPVDWAIN